MHPTAKQWCEVSRSSCCTERLSDFLERDLVLLAYGRPFHTS